MRLSTVGKIAVLASPAICAVNSSSFLGGCIREDTRAEFLHLRWETKDLEQPGFLLSVLPNGADGA